MPFLILLKVHLLRLVTILILGKAVVILQIKNLNPFLKVKVIQQVLHFIKGLKELEFMTYLSRPVHFAVKMAE